MIILATSALASLPTLTAEICSHLFCLELWAGKFGSLGKIYTSRLPGAERARACGKDPAPERIET